MSSSKGLGYAGQLGLPRRRLGSRFLVQPRRDRAAAVKLMRKLPNALDEDQGSLTSVRSSTRPRRRPSPRRLPLTPGCDRAAAAAPPLAGPTARRASLLPFSQTMLLCGFPAPPSPRTAVSERLSRAIARKCHSGCPFRQASKRARSRTGFPEKTVCRCLLRGPVDQRLRPGRAVFAPSFSEATASPMRAGRTPGSPHPRASASSRCR